jgi:hypothetical protein
MMKFFNAKLVNKEVVPINELCNMSFEERRIGSDNVGDYWISTVFLGMNHRFNDNGPDLWFETRVFHEGTRSEDYIERYSTYTEAEEGHKGIVRMYQGQSNESNK